MKMHRCSALLVLLGSLAIAQDKSSSSLTLEDGTPIRLRLGRTVSSEDSHVGDRVDFEVLEEVRVNDVLVIQKGALALATVTAAEPKKRMARGGKLNINIDDVRLVSGEKVALRAIKEVKGGGHTGVMVGGMVATGIVFFPAAPLFLFLHGKEITIPKGTETTAYINGTAHLDALNFRITGAAVASSNSTSAPGQSNSNISVTQQGKGASYALGDSDATILARTVGIQVTEWNEGGEEGGIQITEVAPSSAASSAWLHPGDVIRSLNGKAVRTPTELAAELAKHSPGSQVRIGVMFHTSASGWVSNEAVVTLPQNR